MRYPKLVTAIGSAALLLGLDAGIARAQGTPHARFRPYAFAAPGGISDGGGTRTLHVGGGFDALIWNGFGASFEGGYLGPFPDGFDYGIGLVSANAVYHFNAPERHRLTPFVTGGYTLGFRSSVGQAVNFGAGVNYWLSDGIGLRVELRDHLPIDDGGIRDAHLWGMRVGFTWSR